MKSYYEATVDNNEKTLIFSKTSPFYKKLVTTKVIHHNNDNFQIAVNCLKILCEKFDELTEDEKITVVRGIISDLNIDSICQTNNSLIFCQNKSKITTIKFLNPLICKRSAQLIEKTKTLSYEVLMDIITPTFCDLS